MNVDFNSTNGLATHYFLQAYDCEGNEGIINFNIIRNLWNVNTLMAE